MRPFAVLAGVAVMASSAVTAAQGATSPSPITFEVGAGPSYLLAGGGKTAKATGGFAMVTKARFAYALASWFELAVTASPIFVTPQDHLGVVGLLDLGVVLRSPERTVTVGVAGSGGAWWGVFCNAKWCYEQVTPAFGATVDVAWHFTKWTHLTAFGRGLYAEPDAWTWQDGLDVPRFSWVFGGGGGFTF